MTILCAVDGETVPDRVVTVGHDLATNYGTDLIVLNVMTRDRYETLSTERVDFFMDDATTEARDTARSVVDETLEEGASFTPRGRIGDPTEEVLEEAVNRDAEFLVIGGRKRSPVGKALFGSTTQALLLGSQRPVVTVINE